MVYAIFEVKKDFIGKIDQVIRDDVVSRQSITTRDASSLDLDKDVTYVKIEGSDKGVKRAEELFKEIGVKKLAKKNADEINEKIMSQDESAATGMGMIFD
ncbi:MAG: hypothetical protein FE035_01485 [Thermoplasmata archaeon]|nr:MAG: hypothetical protein FE035_01485 [Thermoplasmata archaeon]